MIHSIAVVVPILNEARSLPALLEGIRRQGRRPEEILIVDSGSTDGSAELVREWWGQNA
ncbi:MAG: glycosyltransferase [Acidobacteria bacterium]|nr:glycosyltransferase [Acidobacteriota bacterium]